MTEMAKHDAARTDKGAQRTIRVWDPLVRLFHWSLVAAMVVVWLSSEGYDDLHIISGYTVAGLIAARLVWGLVGGKYARFSQFLRAPFAVIAYLRDMIAGRERRYLGHNPAGAAMIALMLVALAGTAYTGWLLVEAERIAALPEMPQIVAPAFAGDGGGGNGGEAGIIGDLHEVLASLTLWLIALHVGGVILASWRHRENLARAMVTGDKRAPGPGDVT